MNSPSEHEEQYSGQPAIGYIRMSDAELELGFTVEAQIEIIRRFTSDRNLVLVKLPEASEGILWEVASGRKRHRTEKFELIAQLARERRIRFVIIRDQDRWFRNEMKRLDFEAKYLAPYGVELVFINEGEIPSLAQRRLVRGIKGVISEFYAEQTREKIIESFLIKAGRGEYCGGNLPYGYRRVQIAERVNKHGKKRPVHSLALHQEESRIVLFMKELYGTGHSIAFEIPAEFRGLSEYGSTVITQILNGLGFKMRNGKPFSTAFVKKLLRDEHDHHLGTLTYWKCIGDRELRTDLGRSTHNPSEIITKLGAYPPVVSESLQRQCQQKLASNRARVRFAVKSEYLGSGIYRHSHDGAVMLGRTRAPWGRSKHRDMRYMCADRYNKRGCTGPMVDADAIHATAEELFGRFVASPETQSRLMVAIGKLKAEAAKKRPVDQDRETLHADLARQKSNLIQNLKESPGIAKAIGPELVRLEAEIQRLEAAMAVAARPSSLNGGDPIGPTDVVESLVHAWNTASIRTKNRILKMFIKKAVIDVERHVVSYHVGIPLAFFGSQELAVTAGEYVGAAGYSRTSASLHRAEWK